MNRKITMLLATATLMIGPLGLATAASAQGSAAPSPATSHPSSSRTPTECIRLNHGDFNACNVGNSGRGDLPYLPVTVLTPDECIRLNLGDYNACNVGNSGAGNLSYVFTSR